MARLIKRRSTRTIERIPLYGEEERRSTPLGLYEITVFELRGSERIKITAMEVRARDAIHALDLAAVTMEPLRAIEIREARPLQLPIERPQVNRMDPSAIE